MAGGNQKPMGVPCSGTWTAAEIQLHLAQYWAGTNYKSEGLTFLICKTVSKGLQILKSQKVTTTNRNLWKHNPAHEETILLGA